MKNILIYIIVNLLFFEVRAQEIILSKNENQWYPEKSISNTLREKSSINAILSSPIKSFSIKGDIVIVNPSHGKISGLKISKVGSGKIELINNSIFASISSAPNLYNNYRYFLTKKDQKYLLEIEKEDSIDSVYYINGLDDFLFTYPDDTYAALILAGSYMQTVVDSSFLKEYPQSNNLVEFKLNGKIVGSKYFKGFKFLHVSRSKSLELYHVYSLEFLDKKNKNEPLNLALKYFPLEEKWKGYQYKEQNHFYDIEILEQILEFKTLQVMNPF